MPVLLHSSSRRLDDRRAILVTFTELGRTTTQALADGHRELARQLFAGMPAEAFDGLDAGLTHVVNRLRIASIASGTRSQAARGRA